MSPLENMDVKPRNYTYAVIVKRDPRRLETRIRFGESDKQLRSRARRKRVWKELIESS